MTGENNYQIFYSILRDIVAECSTRDSMWCYIKHRDGTGLSTLRSVSPLRMGCMHNSRFRVVEGKRRRRKKRKHFDHGKTTGVDFQLSWKRYLKAFESRIPLTRPSLERSRILLPYLVKIAKKREKKKKKDYSDNLKPSILHESIEVSSLREMKLHFVRLWNVVSFYPSFYSANIFEQASPRILKGKKKKKKNFPSYLCHSMNEKSTNNIPICELYYKLYLNDANSVL